MHQFLSKNDTTDVQIQSVINSGIVPKIIYFMQRDDPQFQLECAWIITNIASGNETQTRFIIKSDAIPSLIKLLNSKNEEVREQAVCFRFRSHSINNAIF